MISSRKSNTLCASSPPAAAVLSPPGFPASAEAVAEGAEAEPVGAGAVVAPAFGVPGAEAEKLSRSSRKARTSFAAEPGAVLDGGVWDAIVDR